MEKKTLLADIETSKQFDDYCSKISVNQKGFLEHGVTLTVNEPKCDFLENPYFY